MRMFKYCVFSPEMNIYSDMVTGYKTALVLLNLNLSFTTVSNGNLLPFNIINFLRNL